MPLGYYHPQHAYSGPMGGRGGKTGSASSGTGVTAEGLYSRVKNYVGTKVTGPRGGTFEVTKKSDGSVVIVMTVPGKAATTTTKATSATKTTVTKTSSNWITVAQTTLELIRTQGLLAGTKSGSTGSNTGAGTGAGSDAGAGGSTGGSTGGSSGGAQAPAWASAIYLAEMKALIGTTLPSNLVPNLSFTIKEGTLDGVSAPIISVTPSGGTATDVTPAMTQWSDTASQVLAAKYAKDAGTAPPTGTSGTVVVTSETTSPGYDIMTSDTVPSSDQALADQAVATVDAAVAETETAPAPSGAMTVSSSTATATGGEGFFSKYKWWLLGGAAIVAYTQREAIMKMVKK